MRAAAYYRISDDASGERAGVTRQKEDCVARCAREGWQVVAEFCDNDLGASTRSRKPRPEYAAMLKAADAGQFDLIIAYSNSRLTRRPMELEGLIQLHERTGVRIVTVVSGDDNLSTADGRMVARIKASVDAAEAERSAERTSRAARQRAEKGLSWCSRRPFGYGPDGTSTSPAAPELRTYYERVHARRPDFAVPPDVELAVLAARIPREAQLLRDAYTAILAGASVRGIAQRWNEAGVSTSTGARWHGASVSQLLRNPRNAGRRTRGRDAKRVEVGPAAWPAIVDETTFRAVVAILTEPGRRVGPDRERKYLLTGIALCGKCGAPMGSGRATSTGAWVYTCKRHHHLSRAGEPVDDLVARMVAGLLSRPGMVARLTASDEPAGPDLNAEAVALRSRLDSLAVEFADGLLTASQLRAATERLRARLGEVESRMRAASRAPVLAELVGVADVAARWEALPLDRKRAVVAALLTVTILPAGRGRGFKSRTVRLEPRI